MQRLWRQRDDKVATRLLSVEILLVHGPKRKYIDNKMENRSPKRHRLSAWSREMKHIFAIGPGMVSISSAVARKPLKV